MFVCTTVIQKYMKLQRNDENNLSRRLICMCELKYIENFITALFKQPMKDMKGT